MFSLIFIVTALFAAARSPETAKLPAKAGAPVTFTQSYLIGGLLALAINASFFVPFELGSKEAALYFIYHIAGLTPELGVATSVITRVRELAWVAIGVGLVWVAGRRVRAVR